MFQELNGKKIAQQELDIYKKTLDTIMPPLSDTAMGAVSSYMNPKKQPNDNSDLLVEMQKTMQNIGRNDYAFGEAKVDKKDKVDLFVQNKNLGELYTTLSDGSLYKNFDTYTPGANNYENHARNQGTGEKVWNGLVKGWDTAGVGLVGGTVGTVYGLGAMIAEGRLASFYDNDFAKELDLHQEKMRLDYQHFVSEEDKKNGFLGKGVWNVITDDVIQGVAFTTGALATEAVWAFVTGGTSLATTGARLGASTARLGTTLGKTVKLASQARKLTVKPQAMATLRTLSAASKTGAIWGGRTGGILNTVRAGVTSAGYEAGFEARSFMNDARKDFDLRFEKENGRKPNEEELKEFNTELDSTANNLFAFNVALVGTSNIAQFGKILKLKTPSLGIGDYLNKKVFGSGVKLVGGAPQALKATKLQKGLQVGYSLSKGAFTEGLWEEGLQSVGSNVAGKYMESAFDLKHTEENFSLVEATQESLAEQYGTTQGWRENVIGMMVGAFTGSSMGIYRTKSLNHEFVNNNLRSEQVEKLFGESNTYSSKSTMETLMSANRVLQSQKVEKEAEQKGDLLGGQQARYGQVFAGMTRANNLEYLDDYVEQLTLQVDSVSAESLAETQSITLDQAEELKSSMKAEISNAKDMFNRNAEFANYFIGNKLTKEEMKIVEEKAELEGVEKSEVVGMLKDALTYEMFMGDVSLRFADEMFDALQNEVQNTIGVERVRKALTIVDVIKKSERATNRDLNKTKNELVTAEKEFQAIEEELRDLENVAFDLHTDEERVTHTKKLNELVTKKAELLNKKKDLTDKFNTLKSSVKLQGVNISTEQVTESDILTYEKEVSDFLDSLDTLEQTNPQIASRLKVLTHEYTKAVDAYRTYAERTSQINSKGLGLRGKRNIFSQVMNSKSPTKATRDMILGLLSTSEQKKIAQEQGISNVIKGIKNAKTVVTLPTQQVTNNPKKDYILEQIKNNPYLFESIGENYQDALPTEEEVNEYYNLFLEKLRNRPYDSARLDELNFKMSNWQILSALTENGVSIAEMIEQDVLSSRPAVKEKESNEQEVTVETIINQNKNTGDASRKYNILQTIKNVFVDFNPGKFTYISHMTPGKFLQFIGEGGQVKVHFENAKGEIVGDVIVTDADNVNSFTKKGAVITFGNSGKIVITDGNKIKIPSKKWTSDYRHYFSTVGTNSGYSLLYNNGEPIESDFADSSTYSASETYNLKNGDTLEVRYDPEDEYNKNLPEADREANVKLSLYDSKGNKVGDFKADYGAPADTYTAKDYKQEGDDVVFTDLNGNVEVTPLKGQDFKTFVKDDVTKRNAAIIDSSYNGFLEIRAKTEEKIKNGDTEIGEINVSTILVGSMNVKLNPDGSLQQFEIKNPDSVKDYGMYNAKDRKVKLKGALKGVRVDLLKGLKEDTPIIVVQEGNTLVAIPVNLNSQEGKFGDAKVNENAGSPSKMVIAINNALIENGKNTLDLFYFSAEDQNIFDENGDNTKEFQEAIDKLNSIPTKVDYKKDWYEDTHTKDNLIQEISTNIDLEGVKFLSPKVVVNLGSFFEFSPKITSAELVANFVRDMISESKVGKSNTTIDERINDYDGNSFTQFGQKFSLIEFTKYGKTVRKQFTESNRSLIDEYIKLGGKGSRGTYLANIIETKLTNFDENLVNEYDARKKSLEDKRKEISDNKELTKQLEKIYQLNPHLTKLAEENKQC